MKQCTSCNKQVISDFVEFPCPGFPKIKVVRCHHCRETAKTYTITTDEGTFTGP